MPRIRVSTAHRIPAFLNMALSFSPIIPVRSIPGAVQSMAGSVCMYACMCTRDTAHRRGQRTVSAVSPGLPPWSLVCCCICQATQPTQCQGFKDPPVPAFHSAGITDLAFMWVLGFELRSSCYMASAQFGLSSPQSHNLRFLCLLQCMCFVLQTQQALHGLWGHSDAWTGS